ICLRPPGLTSSRSRSRVIIAGYSPFTARSHVAVSRPREHLIALNQLLDTVVERELGLETCGLDLRVRHDVVALVWVLGDVGLRAHKAWNVPGDGLTEFQLRQVGVRQTYIIGLPAHVGR